MAPIMMDLVQNLNLIGNENLHFSLFIMTSWNVHLLSQAQIHRLGAFLKKAPHLAWNIATAMSGWVG